MNFKALGKLLELKMRFFIRDPAATFFTLALPLLLLVVFGAIMGNNPGPNGFGYLDHELPNLVAIVIATIAWMGIPIEISQEIEKNILRFFKTTPLGPYYFLTDIVANTLIAVGGFAILLLIGTLVYALKIGDLLAMVFAFILVVLALFSTGYLIAVAPTSRAAQAIGQTTFFVNLFLSGATFPREIMPNGLQLFSDLLPLTHAVNLLKGAWLKEGLIFLSLIYLICLTALVIGFGLRGRKINALTHSTY